MFLVVRYVNSGRSLLSGAEEDTSAESDCEETSDESPDTKGEEEQSRSILTTGTFPAYAYFPRIRLRRGNDGFHSWKSLFFYRCTDVISFAPLLSQGAEPRLNYIRQHTTAKTPPPCSPKSVYVLAALVG